MSAEGGSAAGAAGDRRSGRRAPARDRAFRERYGPAALVTGAAQGIGLAFAEALAARGLPVFLIDVQAVEVVRAAEAIAERFGVPAWPIAVDLAHRSFLDDVTAAIEREADGTPVGLVVCNAAIGLEGPFIETPLEDLHRSVEVNCQAVLTLTHHFGGRMAARGRGGLLLIASGTALQGSPGFAGYAATKAFDLVLGESLHYELKESGVDVLAFVPGPTNTPGLRSSLPTLREGVEVGPIRLPGPTVEAALAALGKRASAARQRTHAARLAARRRAAEQAIARRRDAE